MKPTKASAIAAVSERDKDLEAVQKTTTALRPKNLESLPESILPIEEEAYALAVGGRNIWEIASTLSATRSQGLITPEQVQDWITQASNRRQITLSQTQAHHFALDVERLESVLAANWPRAMMGDVQAGALVTKILQRKAEMLGLDAPEVRMSITQAAGHDLSEFSPEELDAFARLLSKAERKTTLPGKTVRDLLDVPTTEVKVSV